MALGERAPFAGQLLTPQLALRVGQGAGGCAARIQAAVGRCQQDADIELAAAKQMTFADTEAARAQQADLQAQLDETQKQLAAATPPWFAQPWFVGPVAAVLSAGVVVWALHH